MSVDVPTSANFDDDPPPEPREGWLLVRIHVPELNVFKCLQFPSERLVWDVKQQVLASLPKVRIIEIFLVLKFYFADTFYPFHGYVTYTENHYTDHIS